MKAEEIQEGCVEFLRRNGFNAAIINNEVIVDLISDYAEFGISLCKKDVELFYAQYIEECC